MIKQRGPDDQFSSYGPDDQFSLKKNTLNRYSRLFSREKNCQLSQRRLRYNS